MGVGIIIRVEDLICCAKAKAEGVIELYIVPEVEHVFGRLARFISVSAADSSVAIEVLYIAVEIAITRIDGPAFCDITLEL